MYVFLEFNFNSFSTLRITYYEIDFKSNIILKLTKYYM